MTASTTPDASAAWWLGEATQLDSRVDPSKCARVVFSLEGVERPDAFDFFVYLVTHLVPANQEPGGYSVNRGRVSSVDHQTARDSQKMWCSGRNPGSSSSDPAGTINSLPLRVLCGKGEPHSRQKHVAKLRASG